LVFKELPPFRAAPQSAEKGDYMGAFQMCKPLRSFFFPSVQKVLLSEAS